VIDEVEESAMKFTTRRNFLRIGLAAGAAVAVPAAAGRAAGANDAIRLGLIGCGGRGNVLLGHFTQIDGVRIGGLCDPDQRRLHSAGERFGDAKRWADLREMLDDDSIDAVVIASAVHWHALATILAVQAGKDVYCEKPMSHNLRETRQAAAAVEKSGRIWQHGTQQQSDPMRAEIRRFLHDDRALGKVLSVRVNRYDVRPPIGKRDTSLSIPEHIDYNLWLGPAQDMPLYRNNLQYDWHWDWNTGAGEMGNWGVHLLDDVRNNVLPDNVALPRRIGGGGGRVAFGDAGQTPNVHFVYFDTGDVPVVMGLSNLPAEPGSRNPSPHTGPSSGYIAYCEGGRLEAVTAPWLPGRAVALDRDGKEIRRFSGAGGDVLHQQNFIDAVRSRKASLLHSPIRTASDTAAWCHLANIAVRAGGRFSRAEAAKLDDPARHWNGAMEEMARLLHAHGLDMDNESLRLSGLLTFDSATEQFVGEAADAANSLVTRTYRAPFALPIPRSTP
jgi:hypothetical protein